MQKSTGPTYFSKPIYTSVGNWFCKSNLIIGSVNQPMIGLQLVQEKFANQPMIGLPAMTGNQNNAPITQELDMM